MGKVKSGGQSDFSGDFCSKIEKFDTSTETKTYFVNFYEKNTSTIKKKLFRLKFLKNTFRNYLMTFQILLPVQILFHQDLRRLQLSS